MDLIGALNSNNTLAAVDAAMELEQDNNPRPYLGASIMGDPCPRKLWYGFRWYARPTFFAKTLRAFEDGHRTEDLMAERLRLVLGSQLETHDPVTGKQFGFVACDGHVRGHCDGLIQGGLKEAPQTAHVWEHKATNESKFKKLEKLIAQHGEKAALVEWDEIYHGQAQVYMMMFGMTRHYLTVTTPGGRDHISVRTELNKKFAESLMKRAQGIIASDKPPPRMNEDPTFYLCKWCDYQQHCHYDAAPDITCRSCSHSYAAESGKWYCDQKEEYLDRTAQEMACHDHDVISRAD